MSSVFKPTVVIEELGELGVLPDGGILNAGGVKGPNFTVGGVNVLLNDGSLTGGTPISGLFKGYEHIQAAESKVWIITHALESEKLSVMIWDSENDQVFPDVIRIASSNSIHILFNTAMSGRAILMTF